METERTRSTGLLHTHLNQHVCCTLLLAALFYRAIYSSVSCLICFVWRKVNLEIEANSRQFEWSQAGVSAAATCVLLAAAHSGRFTSHPDIMNIYVWVLVFTFLRPHFSLEKSDCAGAVLCLACPALQWKKCGWNYRFEGELNLWGHLCTWKLL